jgi:ubiquinone/menaquinone biosynthesis C-methylase UbiE
MCHRETGFLLHPTIPTQKDGLKIADVACGTGYVLGSQTQQVTNSEIESG